MATDKRQRLTGQMKEYIRTTVREELIGKRCNKDDADRIVEDFINNPDNRDEIIDEWLLDSIRICDRCGQPMYEGYIKDDRKMYCSEECVRKACGWDEETFKEHISHAEEMDAEIYWTEWEG